MWFFFLFNMGYQFSCFICWKIFSISWCLIFSICVYFCSSFLHEVNIFLLTTKQQCHLYAMRNPTRILSHPPIKEFQLAIIICNFQNRLQLWRRLTINSASQRLCGSVGWWFVFWLIDALYHFYEFCSRIFE